MKRRRTRTVTIGNIKIGSGYPIAIQSMLKVKTSNISKALKEIADLKKCGCQIIRLAVKDSLDAEAIKIIKKNSPLPLVADIHFNWLLASESIKNGVDKIRINPGNIYEKEQVCGIVKLAKKHKIPIRIGLNSGSLPLRNYSKEKASIPEIMVKEALKYIKIFENLNFYDTVVSLKASGIMDTVDAYRLMSKTCDYPFHLGVTACGPIRQGSIKSSIAIGSLLLDGIGDTIRVSLTANPKEEVMVAKRILESLGLGNFGPEIISCPTCGRCQVDLINIVKNLEKKLAKNSFAEKSSVPLKIAVMGCAVNGPGEAKEADLGVAFGKNNAVLFKRGKAIKKISFARIIDSLLNEMERI